MPYHFGLAIRDYFVLFLKCTKSQQGMTLNGLTITADDYVGSNSRTINLKNLEIKKSDLYNIFKQKNSVSQIKLPGQFSPVLTRDKSVTLVNTSFHEQK